MTNALGPSQATLGDMKALWREVARLQQDRGVASVASGRGDELMTGDWKLWK